MKFCVECGSKLELACPSCGFCNSPSFKFCGECGCDLRKPRDAPHIDFSQPQSYTPKFLAEKILTTRSSIEGERKLVTVLFADVANYTSPSEKLDPEEVHQIMDKCFKILMDEIHKDTFWIRCLSHRSERSSSLPCAGTRSAEVKVAEDKVHGPWPPSATGWKRLSGPHLEYAQLTIS
jgi:hypothetical protein